VILNFLFFYLKYSLKQAVRCTKKEYYAVLEVDLHFL
jgi:hypothetical protein